MTPLRHFRAWRKQRRIRSARRHAEWRVTIDSMIPEPPDDETLASTHSAVKEARAAYDRAFGTLP